MGTYTANWEDEENNRRVELRVEYDLAGGELTIERVVPLAVSFTCRTSGQVTRRIGVHTTPGREMLARQFSARVGTAGLWREIEQSLRVPA